MPKLHWLKSRLRFSLRTLLLSVMLGFCVVGMYSRWEPWFQESTLPERIDYRADPILIPFQPLVVFWTEKDELLVWNYEVGRIVKSLGSGERFYRVMSVSKNGKYLVVDWNNQLRVFSTDDWSARPIAPGFVHSARWLISDDGEHLAIGYWDPKASIIELWKTNTGQLEFRIDAPGTGHGEEVGLHDFKFSADGKRLMAYSADAFAQWDLATQKRQYMFWGQYSPDDEYQPPPVEEAATLQQLQEFARQHGPTDGIPVRCFASPDGNILLTHLCAAHRLSAWDIRTGNRLGELTNSLNPHAVSFSDDGRFALLDATVLDPDSGRFISWKSELWDLEKWEKRGDGLETPKRSHFLSGKVPEYVSDGSQMWFVPDFVGENWSMLDMRDGSVRRTGQGQLYRQCSAGHRLIIENKRHAFALDCAYDFIDTRTGESLFTTADDLRKMLVIDDDASRYVVLHNFEGQIWSRRRPEQWWGVFWMWEFWLGLLFAGALGLSFVRNRQQNRRA